MSREHNVASERFRLTGRRAVITGGTQGVGGGIAKAIAAAGADVVLVGLREDDRAHATLQACRDLNQKAELVLCDLARPPHLYLESLLEKIDEKLPNVDLLVNNAGIYNDTTYLEMDWKRYEITMNLNVASGFFLTQALARRWAQAGTSGRVLFTGSINGFLAEPNHVAYDTSKGAVASMVRSLCVSLAPLGIRVNSMAPGLVRTPLTDVLNHDKQLDGWMKLHTPNGEVPEADVCAETAVFLLSDAARHIHGQTILVDGGMSAWQQPDPPKEFNLPS